MSRASARGDLTLKWTLLRINSPGQLLGIVVALITMLVFTESAATAQEQENAAGLELFEEKIRPVLVHHCYRCHSADAERGTGLKGALRLDTRENIRRGGTSGPAVVPGDVEGSMLISALRQDAFAMPPTGKLPDEVIEDFVRWVQMGAPDPRDAPPEVAANKPVPYIPTKIDLKKARQFWSFQPPQPPEIPTVQDTAWPRADIDRFILAKLEANNLRPAEPTNKRTWLRRVTFDLIGLPPAPEEIDAFLADQSPEAFERVVERLLASPHYGERWGRHWLDVVRYSDTFVKGEPKDFWNYRDWAIEAFNRDLPYNDFIVHQIAGDLIGGENDAIQSAAATQMLLLGHVAAGNPEKMASDIVDDQVDVVTRGFLGLTVSCARCHDHKFDPITTADYYGLAGIFFSSYQSGRVLWEEQPKLEQYRRQKQQCREELKALQAKLAVSPAQLDRQFVDELTSQVPQYLQAAWEWHRSSSQPGAPSVANIASMFKLQASVLDAWIRVLGWGARFRPELGKPEQEVSNEAGVYLWTSNGRQVVINANDAPVMVGHQKIPAYRVRIQPSTKAGLSMVWRSPLTGTVAIRGSISADKKTPGFTDWRLYHFKKIGVENLLTEAFDRKEQDFNASIFDSEKLQRIVVTTGDELEIAVLPGGMDVSVELTVEELDGQKRSWKLSDGLAAVAQRRGIAAPEDAWRLGGLSEFFPPIPLPRGTALDKLVPQLPEAGMQMQNNQRDAWWNGGIAVQQAFTAACRQKLDDSSKLAPDVVLAQMVMALSVACMAPDGDLLASLPPDRVGFFLQPVARHNELRETVLAYRKNSVRPYPDDTLLNEAADEARALRDRMRELHGLLRTLVPPGPVFCSSEGGPSNTRYAGKLQDVAIHMGGHIDQLGPVVPRRFPLVLAGEDQKPITSGSGRLELARWIASPENPLVARVIVNRLWLHHFGQGMVRTPDNFGRHGQPPSHPELLDYLALRLMEHGWSLKQLHADIVLSATYRQSSRGDAATREKDPENVFFGRANRIRLDGEQLRDALLAVTDLLDTVQGGPAFPKLETPRRTVYWETSRDPALFNDYEDAAFRSIFDVASGTLMVHQRNVSTSPLQALFMLNNPFVWEQSRHLADRLLIEQETDEQRIAWAYALLYGRPPEPQEIAWGREFLREAAEDEPEELRWRRYCQVLLCANEFVYLD